MWEETWDGAKGHREVRKDKAQGASFRFSSAESSAVMGGWRWQSELGGPLSEWDLKELQERRIFQETGQRKKNEACNFTKAWYEGLVHLTDGSKLFFLGDNGGELSCSSNRPGMGKGECRSCPYCRSSESPLYKDTLNIANS